jgi:outer membrane lipoprotein LolB
MNLHTATSDTVSRLRMAGAIALLALVSGCATLAGAPVDDAALEFELQGRIALRYGNDGGNARLTWRHAAVSDDMMVTNPLGQGIARITRQREEVRLVTADGKEYRAQDAETLTQSVLGWRLPLTGLPDWVRARPVPGRPAQLHKADDGRLASVEQDGWLIEYQAWEGAMPSRMKLSRMDASAGAEAAVASIEIRLIIDKWSVISSAVAENVTRDKGRR